MTEAMIMIRLTASGPRPVGERVCGLNLDEFDLKPGQAMWIKQVTDHHTGKVRRYTSDQQGAVPIDEVDWQPLD